MSQAIIIMVKEFKELLTNRSSVITGALVSILFAVSYGFMMASGTGNTANFPLDSTVFLIAAMLGVFMAYTFDAQVFLREKVDKVIETLLCAPVSLRQVWLGKTLGVSLISYLIALLAMVILVVITSLREQAATLPSLPIIAYLLLVVPVFIAAFADLYGLAQMALGLKENRFIGFVIFLPLFIGISSIPSIVGSGLAVSWLAVGIVLAGSLLLLALAGFLSRFVSKERIITTLS
jgi:ABC-2 type transport system permease protein